MIRKILTVVLALALICCQAGFAMVESAEVISPVEELTEEIRDTEETAPVEAPEEDTREAEKAADVAAKDAPSTTDAVEPDRGSSKETVEVVSSCSEAGATSEESASDDETESAVTKESGNHAQASHIEEENPVVTGADTEMIAGEPCEIEEYDTPLGALAFTYEYEKDEDGVLVLNENGDPIVILKEGQDIPTDWLRNEAEELVLDRNGNPVATRTIPASADENQTVLDQSSLSGSADIGKEILPDNAGIDEASTSDSEKSGLSESQSTDETSDPVETGNDEDDSGETSADDEEIKLIEVVLIPVEKEIVIDGLENTVGDIEIIITESEDVETRNDNNGVVIEAYTDTEASGTSEDVKEGVEEADSELSEGERTDSETVEGEVTDSKAAEGEQTESDNAAGEMTKSETAEGEKMDSEAAAEETIDSEPAEGETTDPEAVDGEETDPEPAEGEQKQTEAGTVAEEETDSGSDETVTDGEADPACKAEKETAQEVVERERKAVVHSSVDKCITAGETICLTVDLTDFADCEEVRVVWEVNRGDGWEEAGTGESFAYTATAESLGWDIQFRVQYIERKPVAAATEEQNSPAVG